MSWQDLAPGLADFPNRSGTRFRVPFVYEDRHHRASAPGLDAQKGQFPVPLGKSSRSSDSMAAEVLAITADQRRYVLCDVYGARSDDEGPCGQI
jgi:hypothetical protein